VERERKPLKQRPSGDKPGRAAAAIEGHSGYGTESMRPHLRALLKLKELMVPQFPPPEQSLARVPRKRSRE
jgi:hypothetical protein